MKCFDRKGERARLSAAIMEKNVVSFVGGESGVGKSHIIETVLIRSFGEGGYLTYGYGSNQLPLDTYIRACLHEERPRHSKIIDNIKNIKLGDLTLSIPFIGRLPVGIKKNSTNIEQKNISHKDSILSVNNPIHNNYQRVYENIARLMKYSRYKAIWISNTECNYSAA